MIEEVKILRKRVRELFLLVAEELGMVYVVERITRFLNR